MTVLVLACLAACMGAVPASTQPFGIHVIDAATGRGVPLVELRTTSNLCYVTDSAGWVAFSEPGLMGQEVWFTIQSHGYQADKDGFGYAGVRLKPAPGGRAVVKINRINVAERLYRTTGQGIYADSVALGLKPPIRHPLLNAGVMGQDSVQTAELGDRILWLWGDTNLTGYPLGHFRMAGATSARPGKGGLDPAIGVNLDYFVDAQGRSRGTCPFPGEGPVWVDGLCVVDRDGKPGVVARYARMKSLDVMLEQGLCLWDAVKGEFQRDRAIPLDEPWRFPQAHPEPWTDGGASWLLFPSPYPCVRVPADLESIRDPAKYQAFTCLADGSSADPATAVVARDASGRANYRWTSQAPPTTQPLEAALIRAGKLKADEAHFQLVDAATGKPVELHGGSVRWNAYRRRWICLAVQKGGESSMLGEVWYAEAVRPEGPWHRAAKVVTHDRYSFYNPVHHSFLDQQGGRLIHFEGTYVTTFSGTTNPTPRYDYNQILYRLDLAHPSLKGARRE